MAQFMDLATELVLAITSYIPKSSDKLHLVLVNRKMHRLLSQELYKRIMLGQGGDHSNGGDFRLTREYSGWDTFRLLRLSNVLKATPPSHKPAVESLDLELHSNTMHESFGCSDLMLYLPSLKSLRLSIKGAIGLESWQILCYVSPSEIVQRLQGVSGTLESLIIDIDQSRERRDGTGIRSLRNFVALKHLGIQSHILFGDHGDDFSITHSDGNGDGIDLMILTKFLPLGLQQLQMSS